MDKVARSVKIDVLPQGIFRVAGCDAIVLIDVVLAGTTIVSSVAQGRRTLLPAGLDEAREIGDGQERAILAQEGLDESAAGFETLGPASLDPADAKQRPLALVTPWTGLLREASRHSVIYVTCLRNLAATAEHLALMHDRVALLGAGFAGEQRCEDRIAAARIASALMRRGFVPEGMNTVQEIESWAQADSALVAWGKSADYLRRQGRQRELDFVLKHQDDQNLVCRYDKGELQGFDVEPLRKTGVSGPVVFAYVSRAALASAELGAEKAKVIEIARPRRVSPENTN